MPHPRAASSGPDGSVADVAADVLPSVVQVKVNTTEGQATGSGFVIDEAGLLVTNNHVVSGAEGRVRVLVRRRYDDDGTGGRHVAQL